jgi:hypothetical protein
MQDSTGVSGSDRIGAARRASGPGANWINMVLVIISILFSLVLIEVAYRLTAGLPVFKFTSWRVDRVLFSRIGAPRAITDPLLGWTLKSWHKDEVYSTIDHGIRTNFGETTVRTGAVLAVGDSFTEGWDVDDDDSWPAWLERFIGTPVVNGGVFGYGTDQIILRAEQLLPIVQPKILIVGFLEFDIFRATHSDFGAPKPYFTLEKDELVYHPPDPIDPSQRGWLSTAGDGLRDVLGYSAAADFVLAGLAPNYWYRGSKILYRKVDIDAAAVTCALLDRLKKQVEQSGIRMLLFMQHNEYLILGGDRPSENARRVIACAEARGIQVVDQFASLRAIAVANPIEFRSYYVPDKQGFGHMTEKGNEHAARLLAEALGK